MMWGRRGRGRGGEEGGGVASGAGGARAGGDGGARVGEDGGGGGGGDVLGGVVDVKSLPGCVAVAVSDSVSPRIDFAPWPTSSFSLSSLSFFSTIFRFFLIPSPLPAASPASPFSSPAPSLLTPLSLRRSPIPRLSVP